ncbi:MAG: hypothetical protein AB1345_09785 [Chloroflexota bacterium]
MKKGYRFNLTGGIILILLGVWFLAAQFVPGLNAWVGHNWPLTIIFAGLIMLLFGLIGGVWGMAVPACIVGGIGGLLFWQNATGNWGSWAYAWTLIPGFVGVGVILSNLLGGQGIRSTRGGMWLIFSSLTLFAIFGSFLGAPTSWLRYWPLLLIVFGIWMLVRSLTRTGRREAPQPEPSEEEAE